MGVLTSVSLVPYYVKAEYLNKSIWGAAIAQWIRLRLPSCHPGFESQAHHLGFYFIYSQICLYLSLYCEKNDNKQKVAGFGPFFKKNTKRVSLCSSEIMPK